MTLLETTNAPIADGDCTTQLVEEHLTGLAPEVMSIAGASQEMRAHISALAVLLDCQNPSHIEPIQRKILDVCNSFAGLVSALLQTGEYAGWKQAPWGAEVDAINQFGYDAMTAARLAYVRHALVTGATADALRELATLRLQVTMRIVSSQYFSDIDALLLQQNLPLLKAPPMEE